MGGRFEPVDAVLCRMRISTVGRRHPLNEFDLIRDVFMSGEKNDPPRASGIRLGIGDDAALLRPTLGRHLVTSVDTLVEGVHFLADVGPEKLGHKSLAVNLSDMAAMGAEPRWFLLALTLPEVDISWLRRFAAGMTGLACRHGVTLVGGDTCRGDVLGVGITVLGEVLEGQALLRSGAKPGDGIYVTGNLGDAAAGLQALKGRLRASSEDLAVLRNRLECPVPRVEVGTALRGLASAAIDLSDGLAADLGHILRAGGCGAHIRAAALPVSGVLVRNLGGKEARALALNAGDDYELCFTLPADRAPQMRSRFAGLNCPVTCIGEIEVEAGLTVLDDEGGVMEIPAGFVHWE